MTRHHHPTTECGSRSVSRWEGRGEVRFGGRTALLWLSVLLCLAGIGPAAAAEPKSVEQFLSLRDNWKQFAEVGTRFSLEGRVSSWSESLLRLRNCSLNFRAESDLTFPRLTSDSRAVELQGFMRMENGRPEFVVTKIEEREEDVTFVRRERLKLPVDDPEPWYEFGEWVRQRAEFYDDEELREDAIEIFTDAVKIARRDIENGDADGLRRLARRTQELDLGKRLRSELIHEAIWVERRNERPLGLVKAEIERDLSGYDKPLEADDTALRKSYLDDPLTVYSRARDAQRGKLHRALYADVCFEWIREKLENDYGNGLEIADRIDREVPEYHDVAETFRDRALERQSRQVATLSRTQAVALSREYESREQPDKAREVLENWIAAQEPRWRKEGTIGQVRLAEERLELLDDKAAAIALLQEAYLKSRGDSEVARKLRELGVVRDGNQWVRLDQAARDGDASLPPAEVRAEQQATVPDPGGIRRGMTRSDVLTRLGRPDSVARLVVSGRLTELWSYGRGTQTIVRFEQRLRDVASDPRVETISTRSE